MSLLTQNLSELIARVEWPEPYLATVFAQDVDHMWGTEGGRAEVIKWAQVLGHGSPFVEGKLWLVRDIKEHFKQAEAWDAQNTPPVEQAPPLPKNDVKRPVGRPRVHALEKVQAARKGAAEWHEAVAQRKAALDAHKQLIDTQIEELRAKHTALVRDWDEYVASKRSAWKSTR